MLPISISSEPAKKPQAVGKASRDAIRTRTEPVLKLLTSERLIMKTPTTATPSVTASMGIHIHVKPPHPRHQPRTIAAHHPRSAIVSAHHASHHATCRPERLEHADANRSNDECSSELDD